MKQTICILLLILAHTSYAQDPAGAKRFTNQMMHSSWVNSVAISPDGTKVISGNYNNSIKIWDINTGKEIQTLLGHSSWVNSLAFSPDAQKICIGGEDNTIKIWDIKYAKEINILSGHKFRIFSVAFSPEGTNIISGSEDNSIKIWDIKTGKEIRTLLGHTSSVKSVIFNSDGTKIISGSNDRTIKVWDAKTGKEIQTLLGHTGKVFSVAVSNDGTKIISGSEDNSIKIWDINTGKIIKTLLGHVRPVNSVTFNSDGTKIISGSNDRTIKIWDTKTGKEVQTLNGHNGSIKSVAISSDGMKIVSGGNDKTIKIWDAKTGKETLTPSEFKGWVTSIAISSDETKIVSGNSDNSIKIWDLKTGQEIKTFSGHKNRISSLAFNYDDTKIISGSNDKTIKIWDVKTGKETHTLLGHSGWIYCLTFNQDATKIISGSEDHSIKIWDTNTGNELKTLLGHTGSVKSVAISFDGTKIISSSEDNTIKIWNINTGKIIKTLYGNTFDWFRSIAISPDGTKIIIGSNNRTIKIWDTKTWEKINTLSGHNNVVQSVAFSLDGTKIISNSLNVVKVWDLITGNELKSWNINFPVIYGAFSDDGKSVNIGTAAYWVNFAIIEKTADSTPVLDIQLKTPVASTKIYWLNHRASQDSNQTLKTTNNRLKIEAIIITSLKEQDLRKSIKIYINGSLFTGKLGVASLKSSQGDYYFEQQISLIEGQNTIEIIVSDDNQILIKSPPLQVFYTSSIKANLYLLTFGVQYNDLYFTDEDAQLIHKLFQSQLGTLFNEVIVVGPYIGDDTDSYKIAKNLERLGNRSEIREQDVLIIFASGHGEILDGDFRILGKDYDDSAPKRSSISFSEDIIANLSKVKGKRIVLIDACLSGASVGKGLSDANQLIAKTPPGMITITSSSGYEKSYEHKAWNNGAFVKGIREALEEGKADKDKDKSITIKELFAYLGMRVPQIVKSVEELKQNEQHPQISNVENLDFPIFLLK